MNAVIEEYARMVHASRAALAGCLRTVHPLDEAVSALAAEVERLDCERRDARCLAFNLWPARTEEFWNRDPELCEVIDTMARWYSARVKELESELRARSALLVGPPPPRVVAGVEDDLTDRREP